MRGTLSSNKAECDRAERRDRNEKDHLCHFIGDAFKRYNNRKGLPLDALREIASIIKENYGKGLKLSYDFTLSDLKKCKYCEDKPAESGGLCIQCEELRAEGRDEL